MVGALWTGISGLAGSQTALDNESNNIANVNTIGYKASRISFADQMYQDKIGKGVTSFDIEKMYTQGNLKNTGVAFDMALSEDGFFTVSDGSETYYTRAGNFRRGESGELEDVAQNSVQGWAMSPITDDDIISTDTNATYFTNEFSEVLGTKIIRDSSQIETVIAKATNFKSTATSDAEVVFTGYGVKTAAAKITDIQELQKEYQQLLATHAAADPKPTATSSSTQKNYLNFNLDSINVEEGDVLYIKIDGNEYQQKFVTDEATTLKMFADQLSQLPGFDAHYTNAVEDNAPGTVKQSLYEYDNVSGNNPKGGLYIEQLVPGMQVRITEFGSIDTSNGSQATKGELKLIEAAVKGTGMGAIESVEEALAKAVSGKQQDVYTANEVMLSATQANNKFTYQINIYDKDTATNINVPVNPLELDLDGNNTGITSIDDMVTAINTVSDLDGVANSTELAYYVKAFNINGNLVVQTLDKNYDVEFSSELKGPIPEQQLIKLSGDITPDSTGTAEVQRVILTNGLTGTTASEEFTFLGHTLPLDNANGTDFDTPIEVAAAVATNSVDIIATWNAANPTKQIASIGHTAGTNLLTITYKSEAGNVSTIDASSSNGVIIGTSTETAAGSDAAAVAFLGTNIAMTKGDSISTLVERIIEDKQNIIDTWNLKGGTGGDATDDTNDDNENREIADIIKISSDEIKIVYKNTEGDVANLAESTDNGIKFDDGVELTKGSFNGIITKNLDFSGREGAAAEFLKITTTINQTAAQDAIQLRLDTLGLTDSAFGDFAVDKSGLVTISQDGVDFAVGQVSIAKFTDNRGLEAVGNNLLKATTRSGSALYNVNNDKTSDVNGAQLELSTSDLSESLVNLMVFQRAFEANAKSITTADSILTTLIQLKR